MRLSPLAAVLASSFLLASPVWSAPSAAKPSITVAPRRAITTSRNGRPDSNATKLAKGEYPWFHTKPAEPSSLLSEPTLATGTDPNVEWREIDQKPIARFQFKNVAQGQVGDCWYLSAMVAASSVRALDLKSALTKNPSRHTLTVRSFNDDGTPLYTEITPTLPINTKTQQLAYATSLDYNPTVALLEKGFAAGRGGYDAINGGWPGLGLSRITGYKHVTMPLSTPDASDPEALTKILRKAGQQHLAMELWTGNAPVDPGIVGGHAYAVVRPVFWDVKSKQFMIGLKNPWGYAVPGDNAEASVIVRKNTYSHGEFDIPVSKLAENFAGVSMAGKKVQQTIDYTGFEAAFAKRADAGAVAPSWKADPEKSTVDAIIANLN